MHAPLQKRSLVLDLDRSRANAFPSDFDWSTIERGRNTDYQQQLAKRVDQYNQEMISLITKAMKIHLNLGLEMRIDSPSISLSLQSVRRENLPSSWNIPLSDRHSSLIIRVRDDFFLFALH